MNVPRNVHFDSLCIIFIILHPFCSIPVLVCDSLHQFLPCSGDMRAEAAAPIHVNRWIEAKWIPSVDWYLHYLPAVWIVSIYPWINRSVEPWSATFSLLVSFVGLKPCLQVGAIRTLSNIYLASEMPGESVRAANEAVQLSKRVHATWLATLILQLKSAEHSWRVGMFEYVWMVLSLKESEGCCPHRNWDGLAMDVWYCLGPRTEGSWLRIWSCLQRQTLPSPCRSLYNLAASRNMSSGICPNLWDVDGYCQYGHDCADVMQMSCRCRSFRLELWRTTPRAWPRAPRDPWSLRRKPSRLWSWGCRQSANPNLKHAVRRSLQLHSISLNLFE